MAIRTKRGTRAAGAPVFSVVEVDGGRVVAADAVGLAELEHRLWAITRDRRLAIDPDRTTTCEQCGTVRVGNFRWCKGCGSDFESQRRTERPSMDPGGPRVQASPRPIATGNGTVVRVEPATHALVAVVERGPATVADHTSPYAVPARSTASMNGWLLTAPDDDLDIVKPFPVEGRPSVGRAALARVLSPYASRIALWLDDVFADSLTPQRLWLGGLIGLAIGVIVTVFLLALD